jgi:voltage-gated potassium channel Kch
MPHQDVVFSCGAPSMAIDSRPSGCGPRSLRQGVVRLTCLRLVCESLLTVTASALRGSREKTLDVRPRVLVLSEPGGLGGALLLKLDQAGATGEAVTPGADTEVTEVLDGPWAAVAVVTRDDVLALRLTLLCAHVRPDLPLWVTVFDRTLIRRLRQDVRSVQIISSAELVAREIADYCCTIASRAPRWRHGLRVVDAALQLLVAAGAGLLGALVVQTVISIIALHESVLNGIYFSTRAIATVTDAARSNSGPAWFKIVSVLNIVVALVLVAVFTAALVRRLSRPRLTTLIGRRAAPARGHVLLVGFGQVGFRLSQALRERGVAMVAVERSIDAPCVRLAQKEGIPVLIGRGDDRGTLELAGARHCSMVAAVTSDDLVNVAVGLTASDMRPGIPLALRLGDGGVASETESLLHLGQVFDAHHLAATTLAEAICATIFPQRTEAPSVRADHLPRPPPRPAHEDGHTQSVVKRSGPGDK